MEWKIEMSKIALMTLLNREDSSLSPHFGKAKWILVRDTEQGSAKFIQNHGLNGRTVVEALLREGCTDVICSEIGQGAVENLRRAQIHGWLAPAGIPVPRLFSEKLHPIQCKNLAAPENAPTMVHKIFHCAESCTSSSASNIVALATNWDELALFSCLGNYFL